MGILNIQSSTDTPGALVIGKTLSLGSAQTGVDSYITFRMNSDNTNLFQIDRNGGNLRIYFSADDGKTAAHSWAFGTSGQSYVDGQLVLHSGFFHWQGKDGQPIWLWGGDDINDYYVYSPSNFNVYSSKLLTPRVGNYQESFYNPIGYQQLWGEAFQYTDATGSTDSGDLCLYLRADSNAGGAGLCMVIDGDYYVQGHQVLNAGNYNYYTIPRYGYSFCDMYGQYAIYSNHGTGLGSKGLSISTLNYSSGDVHTCPAVGFHVPGVTWGQINMNCTSGGNVFEFLTGSRNSWACIEGYNGYFHGSVCFDNLICYNSQGYGTLAQMYAATIKSVGQIYFVIQ